MVRAVIAIGAPVLVLAALFFGAPGRPASGPEPIRYGRDACDRCRMHLSAHGYAAERRDASGALHKYDDIGCLLGSAPRDGAADAWVEDHAGTGFVPLASASLVAGDGLGTPMNYGVVAFRDRARAEEFARARGARLVTLEELQQDSARFGAHAEVHP